MRKILSLIVIAMTLIALADDTLVIVKRDGKMLPIKTDDIDSIRIDDSKNIEPSCFNLIDTLYVHDTVVIEKKIYETVSAADADDWYVNIENPVIAKYMNEVDYTDYGNDYTTSGVTPYTNEPTDYRKDQPRFVLIKWERGGTSQRVILSKQRNFASVEGTWDVDDYATSFCIYNLQPKQTYYYRVEVGIDIVKEGHFTVTGQLRMMYLPSLYNVRDLGGWPTEDGHHLRYGRIYRGSEMNDYYNIASLGGISHKISSADSLFMHDNMKIRLDMDLRDDRDMNLGDKDPSNDRNHTELGDDVEYYNEPVNYYSPYFYTYSYNNNYRFGRTINKIIETLKKGDNVYFHCIWGADRTGTVAMLIEGLCGVSEADINKDYELTAFYSYRNRTQTYWVANLNYIKGLQGNTLRDKMETFCTRMGVTAENIQALRDIMVE